MFVPVKVVGDRIEYEQFTEFAENLQDMSGPLGSIGDRLLEGVAQQFDTEGAWGDKPWAQLTENYGAWKELHGPGLPLLVGLKATGTKGTRKQPRRPKTYSRSGKMRLELIQPSAMTISETDNGYRMLYAPVSDIAGFHEDGTDKMVARPPVVIPLRELGEWDVIFISWLDGLTERVTL